MPLAKYVLNLFLVVRILAGCSLGFYFCIDILLRSSSANFPPIFAVIDKEASIIIEKHIAFARADALLSDELHRPLLLARLDYSVRVQDIEVAFS